jgi:hypothetical protein
MTTKTVKATKTPAKPAPKTPAKPAAKPATAPAGKPTMSSVARDMILAGKTNEEVTAALKAKFGLPEKHKHYASWYRADLVRKGALAKATAKKTAHAPKPAAAKPEAR